jgi:hypothetical protein
MVNVPLALLTGGRNDSACNADRTCRPELPCICETCAQQSNVMELCKLCHKIKCNKKAAAFIKQRLFILHFQNF